jgi:type VI secretion system protein ImpL
MLPQPASGVTEYTVEIDGQQMRYRNAQPQWTHFVWPNAQGTPGAKLTVTTFDGRTIEIVNEPGHFGLEKLIDSAQRTRQADGSFNLSWTKGSITVTVSMRLISTSQAAAGGGNTPQTQSLRGLKLPSSIVDSSAPNLPPPAQPNAPASQVPAVTAPAAPRQSTERSTPDSAPKANDSSNPGGAA